MSEINDLAALYNEKYPSKKQLSPKIIAERTQKLSEEYRAYLRKGGNLPKNIYMRQKMRTMTEGVLPDNMVKTYELAAKKQKNEGASVEIDESLPTVSVKLSDGQEYFFQGEEAQNLLDEVPDNIAAEDYILHNAIGW